MSDNDRVPETFEQFYLEYRRIVRTRLRSCDKLGHRGDDLEQDFWRHLIEVDFLRKYQVSTAPSVIRAIEACAYWQISWAPWESAEHLSRKGRINKRTGLRRYITWMPQPVYLPQITGGHLIGRQATGGHPDAVYAFRDILRLQATNVFHVTGPERLTILQKERGTIPDIEKFHGDQATRKHFTAYLMTRIGWFFYNWCRTHRRHYREEYLDNDELWENHHASSDIPDADSPWDTRSYRESMDDHVCLAHRHALERITKYVDIDQLRAKLTYDPETNANPPSPFQALEELGMPPGAVRLVEKAVKTEDDSIFRPWM